MPFTYNSFSDTMNVPPPMMMPPNLMPPHMLGQYGMGMMPHMPPLPPYPVPMMPHMMPPRPLFPAAMATTSAAAAAAAAHHHHAAAMAQQKPTFPAYRWALHQGSELYIVDCENIVSPFESALKERSLGGGDIFQGHRPFCSSLSIDFLFPHVVMQP